MTTEPALSKPQVISVALGATLTLLCACLLWLLPTPDPRLAIERIQERGSLVIATRNSPSTYFVGAHGDAGFEYELAMAFADHLGVDLKVVKADNFGALFPMVSEGQVDLAAANITVTDERRRSHRFGPGYETIRQNVLYRRGSPRPQEVADLIGKRIAVISGSSYAEALRRLQADYPDLQWQEVDGVGIEELFERLVNGDLDITVADSNIVAIHRRFYPALRVGFDIGQPQQLAWAFAPAGNDQLLTEAQHFFDSFKNSGRLSELRSRYYSYVSDFDPVGAYTFMRHVRERLPVLQDYFHASAEETGIDWRLLAAIGYQESHWNARAVSPTGVRGVMMLTQPTAEQMGVADRHDASESILGGARYLAWMMDRIPARIPMPDRMWMALAAYNVGWGHLEDARVLTERAGDDPDRWDHVRQHLPKLSQESYFKTTRFGYARGQEPVLYVRNVRSYFDILAWLVDREQVELAASDQ